MLRRPRHVVAVKSSSITRPIMGSTSLLRSRLIAEALEPRTLLSGGDPAQAVVDPPPQSHWVFEILAKDKVYDARQPGDSTDYGYTVDRVFSDQATGFYAIGLKSEGMGAALVVRGAELTQANDLFSALRPEGVGYNQFLAGRDAVEAWLRQTTLTCGPVDIVGYSLGGAIAQFIAADYTSRGDSLGQVVTFNSPGISKVYADKFNPAKTTELMHYVVDGDLVSMAGEAFIKGEYRLVSFSDPNLLDKHLLPILAWSVRGYDKPIDKDLKIGTPQSTNTLNNPLFTFADKDYRVALAAAQIAVLEIPALEAFADVPAALTYRQTTELLRQQLGTEWNSMVPLINLIGTYFMPLPVVLSGTAGNDVITLKADDTAQTIQVFINAPTSGLPSYQLTTSAITSLAVDGGGGDDTLVIASQLPFIPTFSNIQGNSTLAIEAGMFALDAAALPPAGNLSIGKTAVVNMAGSVQCGSIRIGDSARLNLPAGSFTVLSVESLSIADTGVLDLARSKLVVRNGNYNDLLAYIKSARSTSANHWSGPGLTSSAAKADATGLTGLALARNDTGDGSLLNKQAIFVRYTWNGDANVDGVVNADDYFRIDSGFISQEKGWYSGDFNYDEVINADDYFLIDSAYIGQSGPLSASKPKSVLSADAVAMRQPAKKAEPEGILSQLFSTQLFSTSSDSCGPSRRNVLIA